MKTDLESQSAVLPVSNALSITKPPRRKQLLFMPTLSIPLTLVIIETVHMEVTVANPTFAMDLVSTRNRAQGKKGEKDGEATKIQKHAWYSYYWLLLCKKR